MDFFHFQNKIESRKFIYDVQTVEFIQVQCLVGKENHLFVEEIDTSKYTCYYVASNSMTNKKLFQKKEKRENIFELTR